jgi:hypothetical protein
LLAAKLARIRNVSSRWGRFGPTGCRVKSPEKNIAATGRFMALSSPLKAERLALARN